MDMQTLLVDHHASIKAVGVSFRPQLTGEGKPLSPGTAATIVPQPDNPYDAHALAICVDGNHVGFVPKALAARIAGDATTSGRVLYARVSEVRHLPMHAFSGYRYSVDGVAWESVPANSAIPLSKVSDPRALQIQAVSDREGVLYASNLRVDSSGPEPAVVWSSPVVGFDVEVVAVGEPEILEYQESA